MNRYLYTETNNGKKQSKSISASSYHDAIERISTKYANKFEDDYLVDCDSFEELKEYLFNNYSITISELNIDVE